MRHSILTQVIGAIGEESFPAISAGALGQFLGFGLAAVIVHRAAGRPAVMFDNFDSVGARKGIENYVRFTHRINPMLAAVPAIGACRARDFAAHALDTADGIDAHLVLEADEELGFRTVGWPQRLEEIGLYFEACGGVVELGFYRERGRSTAPASKLRALRALGPPIAAAFERHGALRPVQAPAEASVLSLRERQVCDLLLMGCSSAAIASRLDISRHTVKDHRKSIFRKLHIGSLAELFALRPDWARPLMTMRAS